MKPDTEPSLQPMMDRAIAKFRLAQPRITTCHGALQVLREHGRQRYAMWLDVRWPEHQSIVSGPACDSAAQAVQAALDKVRVLVESSAVLPD